MIQTTKESQAPKIEDSKPQNNLSDGATQIINKKELPKSLTLYIPENLDLDSLLEFNPPSFKYQKDKFIYIIDLITSIPAKNKNKDYVFIPLYSAILKTKVHNYKKYLEYLVDNKIFIEDNQYIKGKKSKGYAFSEIYRTKIKEVKISYPTLIKAIFKFKNFNPSTKQNFLINSRHKDFSHLSKWFNPKLTINIGKATNWLLNRFSDDMQNPNISNPELSFNMRYIPASKIFHNENYITIDSTAGRLHSTLTQLKSELRSFLRYDNQKLFSVDIVNSQPFLILVLLNRIKFEENKILEKIELYNNRIREEEINKILYYVSKFSSTLTIPDNVKNYINSVSNGKFYENFGDNLESKGLLVGTELSKRNAAKLSTFNVLFSPNTAIGFNPAIRNFKEIYPDIYNILSLIKYGRKQHSALACVLQNFEADLILNQTTRKISTINPEIPLFTLHDSIITTENYISFVKNTMIEVITSAIGVPPTLKVEQL